ncbi:hypothetical protein PMAYCL1PPCAC_10634, partial [Pristionchus mayeri]
TSYLFLSATSQTRSASNVHSRAGAIKEEHSGRPDGRSCCSSEGDEAVCCRREWRSCCLCHRRRHEVSVHRQLASCLHEDLREGCVVHDRNQVASFGRGNLCASALVEDSAVGSLKCWRGSARLAAI